MFTRINGKTYSVTFDGNWAVFSGTDGKTVIVPDDMTVCGLKALEYFR